ncbi:MAG: bifunctional oligoribonuclease/PAP phosphatase NrnA [Acidobacteriota bacterium]|nr:bifunctional oligoribonuclease/PAP phosphatase NrnA [Blastocatellia bacterium]MDW8413565.1 bifunctional oligoribonuclease/PAP phosphatase NrnA [Acidobacteriota bacterium]
MLSQVVELIETKNRFCITSHVRPDGDSMGSSLALYWILKSLNKQVDVLMRDGVPQTYSKLPGAKEVLKVSCVPTGYDAAFVIECSDIDRPGLLNLDKQFVVNIDHHSTTTLFGAINWIDSTASAVGEMIYNLCKALGVAVNQQIAECIYTALLTDTGSFHYSNTTERTFKIASELVRKGARPAHISQALFYSYPFSKIKILASALSSLDRDESGRIAWLSITLEQIAEANATEEDLDGIVNYPLAVGEVEVVAFFKEIAPEVYRISLRSKGEINVARVAEKFGGGGHRNASGCTIKGSLEYVKQQTITCLQEELDVSPATRA